jgi:hypothetical protein
MAKRIMNDRNQQNQDRPDDMSGKGRQGIDKNPGEKTSGDPENVVADTQKGKNKVDGDPSQAPDKPVQQR